MKYLPIVVVCSPGYAKNETLGCTICPVDTYDNGTNYCVPCDDSFSTNDQEGGVDSSACNYSEHIFPALTL